MENFLTDLTAGGMAAVVSKCVSAPLERAKLLLQTQRVNTGLEQKYSGLLNLFVRVYKEQGLRSFWRGNMANIARFFPNHALNFALKDKFKLFFVGTATKESNFQRFFVGHLLAGGSAGAVALVFCHPLDVMRTQLAADVGNDGNRKHKSYASLAQSVYVAGGGVAGFYRGIGVSLLGVVLFKALFLGGYDISKALLHLDSVNRASNDSNHLALRFVVAQSVTTSVGALCYPIDTVKRRVMMQTKVDGKLLYSGGVDCLRKVLAEDGVKGLYAGFSANLLRGVGGAILLVGYDEIKHLLNVLKQ